MTDKELRKLSRGQLLQMLIDQMEENNRLQTQLEAVREKLHNRQIAIDNCGSLAEAALALNGVFEAADAAARQYVENVQAYSARQSGKDGE